ncbi:MAG: DUF692 domain-containing protein [Beijerinckiaceae bacterium]
MRHKTSLPAAVGVGYKPQHFDAISATPNKPGFLEIHAENYMTEGGWPHWQLDALRLDHALSIHGVGLSLGGTAALDRDHLRRLKILCDRYQPESFSEHLAWSSYAGICFNDLLPIPYTEARLARVAAHIDETQEFLGRRILLENPATYVAYAGSCIPETEFLAELVRRTGCGLLLDVNNVYVSACNHGFDARAYLAQFPLAAVEEIHLAGHDAAIDAKGAGFLIDSHGAPIIDAVFALYGEVLAATGPLPTLIERDNNVPEWAELDTELQRAVNLLCASWSVLAQKSASAA